jgi:hypothetical protein
VAKCVKNKETGKVVRVNNEQARKMVDSKEYEYCPKFEYKRQEGK